MKLTDFLEKLCDYGVREIAGHDRTSLLYKICDDDRFYSTDQILEIVRKFAEVDEVIQSETENITIFREDDKYYAVFYQYNSYDGSSCEYIGEVKPEHKVITVWKRLSFY